MAGESSLIRLLNQEAPKLRFTYRKNPGKEHFFLVLDVRDANAQGFAQEALTENYDVSRHRALRKLRRAPIINVTLNRVGAEKVRPGLYRYFGEESVREFLDVKPSPNHFRALIRSQLGTLICDIPVDGAIEESKGMEFVDEEDEES